MLIASGKKVTRPALELVEVAIPGRRGAAVKMPRAEAERLGLLKAESPTQNKARRPAPNKGK